IATLDSAAVSTGHELPPGITAFSFLPSRTPPQTSSISRFIGKPIGSSYIPGLLTCPDTANIRVPPFFGVPRPAYHSPPLRTIAGTELKVSTLLITVGHPYKPATAGKGGRIRGYPRLPSSDSISADSSPHSYAPRS